MEKEKKSVSKLLESKYGKINYNGKRGNVLHETYSRYFKRIFKTSDWNKKLNYRVFSQRLTKAKVDILTDIKKNPDYEIYYEDVKVLLNTLHKEIRQVGKTLAKENYNIIIPQEIEINLFGGEVSFEIEAIGKIGGLKIPARLDCLIEIDSDNFIVRDFKSYEKEKEDDPMNQKSQYHRVFMQVCLYALIFEKERYQKCEAIQIAYFPNKIISYDFTVDLREAAKKFAMDTAFEGFEGISFQFQSKDNELMDEQFKNFGEQGQAADTSPLDIPLVRKDFDDSIRFFRINKKISDDEHYLSYLDNFLLVLGPIVNVINGSLPKSPLIDEISIINTLKEKYSQRWVKFIEKLKTLEKKISSKNLLITSNDISILNDIGDAINIECIKYFNRIKER